MALPTITADGTKLALGATTATARSSVGTEVAPTVDGMYGRLFAEDAGDVLHGHVGECVVLPQGRDTLGGLGRGGQ